MPQESRFDVAIVGAGPAGSATAIHLARAGLRVALVDRASFPRAKPCAEALSPAAEPLLEHLGVLPELVAAHPARLSGFRIFAPNGVAFQGSFAATCDARGQSLFTSGLAVPRLLLDDALLRAARAAGATVFERWRLAECARDGDEWHLRPVDGAPALRARLLIGADGLHSLVARRLGLRRAGRLRKVAVVAHLRGIRGLGAYGEMHVANRRYVGLAPLEPDGDLCNVAIVVDEARDGRQLAGRAEAFLLGALSTFPALRERVGSVSVARRALTISGLHSRVQSASAAGLLLVGDAGGYYDPFTGEGIYRALRSAALAAEVAVPALASGDLSAARLARYDALQRAEFRGKRTIEGIIQAGVALPPLMNHLARRLSRAPSMADTIVAVTGDILPPSAVLRPGFLLRLAL